MELSKHTSLHSTQTVRCPCLLNTTDRQLTKPTFLSSLENEQLNQIVECMEKKTAEPSMDIIVEGSVGERIYVLASGKVQILQSNRVIHTLRFELIIVATSNTFVPLSSAPKSVASCLASWPYYITVAGRRRCAR